MSVPNPNDQVQTPTNQPGTPGQPDATPTPSGDPGRLGSEPQAPLTVNPDDVISLMNQQSVGSVEQLANLINSGRESGNSARLLGDERQKVTDLEAQVALLQTQPTNYDFTDPYAQTQSQPQPQPQPQATGQDVKTAVKEVFTEMNEEQTKATQKLTAEFQALQRQDDFQLVYPVFDKWMRNPQTQARVRDGKSTLKNEWDFVGLNVYKQLVKNMSAGAMDGVTPQPAGQPTGVPPQGQPTGLQTPQVPGQPPASGNAPHVEQGQTNSFVVPGQETSVQQKLNTINQAKAEGSLESQTALQDSIEAFFPELKNKQP